MVAKRVTEEPLAGMFPLVASAAPAANSGALVNWLALAMARLANPLRSVGAVGLLAIKI